MLSSVGRRRLTGKSLALSVGRVIGAPGKRLAGQGLQGDKGLVKSVAAATASVSKRQQLAPGFHQFQMGKRPSP